MFKHHKHYSGHFPLAHINNKNVFSGLFGSFRVSFRVFSGLFGSSRVFSGLLGINKCVFSGLLGINKCVSFRVFSGLFGSFRVFWGLLGSFRVFSVKISAPSNQSGFKIQLNTVNFSLWPTKRTAGYKLSTPPPHTHTNIHP